MVELLVTVFAFPHWHAFEWFAVSVAVMGNKLLYDEDADMDMILLVKPVAYLRRRALEPSYILILRKTGNLIGYHLMEYIHVLRMHVNGTPPSTTFPTYGVIGDAFV